MGVDYEAVVITGKPLEEANECWEDEIQSAMYKGQIDYAEEYWDHIGLDLCGNHMDDEGMIVGRILARVDYFGGTMPFSDIWRDAWTEVHEILGGGQKLYLVMNIT